MKTYKIIVAGRVQGVGFRAHIQQGARKNDLKGSVRNLDDGKVEIILQGSENDLLMMKKLFNSPTHPFMKVNHVDIQEILSDNTYSSFTINY